MYRTVQSSASLAAGSLVGKETGLQSSRTLEPILCVGALIGAAAQLCKVVTSVVQEAVQSSDNSETSTEGTDAATAICTSSLYVSPGRLSAHGHQVPESASVDVLVSAVRGDRTAA
jgi:hypothetical protein